MLSETSMKSSWTNREIEPKYLNNDKQHYYLASNKESVSTLMKSQMEKLTKVLIDWKTEYDTLHREIKNKNHQAQELSKQIELLATGVEKSERKMIKAWSQKDIIVDTLAMKQKLKEEVNYTQKSFNSVLEKLKTDVWMIQKEILEAETESKKLSKTIEMEKIEQKNIQLTYNKVFNKIMEQNSKNEFERNEQMLQLNYYNTIIDQKYSFIQAADERKKRQHMLEEEARWESADKMEVENRQELGYNRWYTEYLDKKINSLLSKYEEIEQVYGELWLWSGKMPLHKIIDQIWTSKKDYNFQLGLYSQNEGVIKSLNKDINFWEKQLGKFTSKGIVYEEEVKKKKIDLNKLKPGNDSITALKMEEEELVLQKEKIWIRQKDVSWVYDKVVHNIISLSNDFANLSKTSEKTELKMQNPFSRHEFNLGNVPKRIFDSKVSWVEPQDKKSNNTDNNKTDVDQINFNLEEKKQEIEEREEERNKNKFNEKQSKDIMNNDTNNNIEYYMNQANSNTNLEDLMPLQEETTKPEEIEENTRTILNQKDLLVRIYNDFIQMTLKKFDTLFLCHSKQDFVNLMREKGIEIWKKQWKQDRSTSRFNPIGTYGNKGMRRQNSESMIFCTSISSAISHPNKHLSPSNYNTNKVTQNGFILPKKKFKILQEDIFRKFLNDNKKCSLQKRMRSKKY